MSIKDVLATSIASSAGTGDPELDSFDSCSCWEATLQGLSRFPLGYSKHGQSQMRFVRALLNITKMTLQEDSNGGN